MLFLLQGLENQLEHLFVQSDVGAGVNRVQAAAETDRIYINEGRMAEARLSSAFIDPQGLLHFFMNISDVAECRMYPLGRPMHYTILGASAM